MSGDSNFAALWSSDGVTRSLAPTASVLPADLPFLFNAGERFGPYTILRPIGKGGMGQVYEAEEIDNGRRIALKLLSRGIGDDEERDRFLREGQLAASLSHPNCVYVFGTTEIQGFPVIAMELAPAGTLKELVVPGSPMPAAKAVDAMLQVIAGLDAAAAIGILHRDIKPSNCFVDRDGRVMVGDFGLSIGAGHHDDSGGTIMGTPGFASPEQLRGGKLDVRSDIYAVGATLYYLLTGRAPFEGPDVMTVITRVSAETAPPVSLARRDIPSRLNAIVAKCLAQSAAGRYESYAALAAALEPFRSAALSPAPLPRRALAGFIDSFAATLPLLPFNAFMSTQILDLERRGEALLLSLPSLAAALIYYAVLEGRWGWSVGKFFMQLRVVDDQLGPPGWRKALLRAFVFIVPAQIISQLITLALVKGGGAVVTQPTTNPGVPIVAVIALATGFMVLLILFSTARRSNGFAALHDRASGTRVVRRPGAIERREVRRHDQERARVFDARLRVGPYLVAQDPSSAARPALVEGYDDRLGRAVWIDLLPSGAAPLGSTRRDVGRPTRTRWLSGRRDGDACWDAYEAIDGRPFSAVTAAAQPWSRVRHWLADLADEYVAGSSDGTLPPFITDCIWITADGRARWLDWPVGAPRDAAPTTAEPPTLERMQRFLHVVANHALKGPTPLPIPARTFLQALGQARFTTAEALAAAANELLRQPPAQLRSRRALQLAACAMAPLVMAVATVSVIKVQARSVTADRGGYELRVCLRALTSLDKQEPTTLTANQIATRDALETYVATHLREEAEDYASYARAFPAVAKAQPEYAKAASLITRQPGASPEDVKKANAIAARVIATESESLTRFNRPLMLWSAAVLIGGGTAAIVAVLGFAGAFLSRGGFTLRAFGSTVVTGDGRDASRVRALGRALLAWSPMLAWIVMIRMTPKIQETTVALALLYTVFPAVLAAGALWAWRHPDRGIQDRVAGTWVVPR